MRAIAVTTAAALPWMAPTSALAQKWSVDTGISSLATWSSNPDLSATDAREDFLLDVRPRIAIRRDGARFQLRGAAALNAVTSANGTQPSRLLPEGSVDARLEAVERFLFIDAGGRAVQTAENPFGARPEDGTTRNTLTAAEVHVSPSIEAEINPITRYRLSSVNSWTRQSGATTSTASQAAGYFGRHSAVFERDPKPFGLRLEGERSETRYRDGIEEPLVLDLVRLSVDYAFDTDFTAGVRVGRERTSLVALDDERTIYGVQAKWQPSPRTTLSMFEEKRFFGSSWRLGLDHRTPLVAWNVVFSRTLDTTPQSLFDLPPTDNVAGLLDAMFTTRFPDPIERARVIRELIATQGLPSSTARPTSVFSQRLSIVTLRSASVVLNGRRNTISLTGFQSRIEDAPEGGILATGASVTNNQQYGTSASWSYRLTRLTSVTGSGEWTRIRALQAPDRSIQRTLKLQVNMQVSPRTNTFAGARYRDIDSNVVTEGREGAVFAGFDHRF